MQQTQLRNKYKGLKNGYNTDRKNMEIKLKAQNKLNEKHFNESMKNLEAQFKETERQRKVQQNMLKKHYEHQRYLMKQRHLELLKIKEKLHNCNDAELNQLNKEKELNERHQKLMDIQRDYQLRNDKTQSNRAVLEQKKQLILNEMAAFDKITGNMAHLNLNTELTEAQMKEIEEFMKHNPEMNKEVDYNDNYDELIGSDNDYNNEDSNDDTLSESEEDEYSQKYRRRQSKRERKRVLSRKKSRGRQQRRRKNSGYVKKSNKNDRDLTRSQSPQVRRFSNRKKNVSIQVRKSNTAKKQPRRSRSIGRSIFGFGKKKNKKVVHKKEIENENEEEYEYSDSYQSETEIDTKQTQQKKTRKTTQKTTQKTTPQTTKRTKPQSNSKSKSKSNSKELLKSGTLYVRLVQARGIFGKKGQKPNSYVELECCDEIYHSSIIKKNNNPEWNEFFKFYVNNYEEDMLILRLIDAKNDHSLAKIKLPVYEFVKEVKDNENYKLNQNVDLNLDVMYEAEYTENSNDIDNDNDNGNGKKKRKRRKSFSQKFASLFKRNKKNKKKE